MTCKELPGAGDWTYTRQSGNLITKLSCPHTRESAASSMAAVGTIELGIDVHQGFYVVVVQEGGGNPKPAQRFGKEAFLA